MDMKVSCLSLVSVVSFFFVLFCFVLFLGVFFNQHFFKMLCFHIMQRDGSIGNVKKIL